MFNSLYLLNYNNYYNRMIKEESSLTAYLEYEVERVPATNFNPADGINTTVENILLSDDVQPDYCIVTDTSNNIVSRWFVIEVNRKRGGQWDLILHRDVITDYRNIIVNAPCFIEKATVNNNDPAIFNSEDMSFNQIKKDEILLENNLKTPWVVAYLSRSHTGEDEELVYNSFRGTFTINNNLPVDDYYPTTADYPLWSLQNKDLIIADGLGFMTQYRLVGDDDSIYRTGVAATGKVGGHGGIYDSTDIYSLPYASSEIEISDAKEVFNILKSFYDAYNEIDAIGLEKNTLTNSYSYDSYLKMLEESNKIIKIGSKNYQVTVSLRNVPFTDLTDSSVTYGMYGVPVNTATTLNTKMTDYLVKATDLNYTDKTIVNLVNLSNWGSYYYSVATIAIEEVGDAEQTGIKYDFNYHSGTVTGDAEYEIIATPLYTTTFNINNTTVTHSGAYGLQWFQALANKYYSSNYCYDLQIVPYCPIDTTDVGQYEDNGHIIYATEDTGTAIVTRAVGFKLSRSSFTITKSLSLSLNSNYKIGNLTELYRITSPNGIGNFEFSPYKNYGFSGYEVDCTLKPISPYIKINPIFNNSGLYGGDYDDFRGLICGGDFSLSITSNAWQTYANNNKYFQDIFDRQIENMEVNNRFQKRNEIWQSIAGTASGAASGAAIGGMLGGGLVGGLIGGATGGVASGIAGAADVYYNDLLRMEAIDYTRDQFGYNLQTIRARPDTLTRSTSYNINNKYFPYIEIFKCTDMEVQALEDKIKYNGMTIMRIGRMINYIKSEPTYIKGQIIRLENLDEDFHVANTIAKEVNMGVFI